MAEYKKISIHPVNLEQRKATLQKHTPDGEYPHILEHLQLLARGEITGKVIGEKRQQKIIDMFVLFFKHNKKPTAKLTKEDMQKFKDDFMNNKIKKENGVYADETKEDCTECICRYLECRFPQKVSGWTSPTGKSFHKWFVIRAQRKTPETINETEVKALIEGCKTIEGKFLVAVLFDSGARIEEFLNIRFEDIELPTKNFPYYKIDFKEEYSKTEGRKIGMYWTETTDLISKYLQICEKKDNKEPIFNKEYDAVRIFLARISQKVLGKHVNPHMLRKSSATYYADKLNRQQLCIRYGWAFSSAMPDVYISRAGVDEGKIKDVMLNDDLHVIKREGQELKTKHELQEKEIQTLKDQNAELRELIMQIRNEVVQKKSMLVKRR